MNGAPVADLEVDRGLVRPDVAQWLGEPQDQRFQRSGWTMRGKLRRRPRNGDVVSITVTCEHGARLVIDSVRVDDLLERMSLPPNTSRVARYLIDGRWALRQGGLRAVAARIPMVLERDLRPLLRRPTRLR